MHSPEEPKNRVLKYSEQALYLDGKYIGELGNSAYGNNEETFDYDPQAGVLLNPSNYARGSELPMLAGSDYVAVPHGYGYLSVDQVFDHTAGTYGDGEFIGRIYKPYRLTLDRFKAIDSLCRGLGIEYDAERQDNFAIARAQQQNPHFTPEELIDATFDLIRDTYRRGHSEGELATFDALIDAFKQTGILEADEAKRRDAVIAYFEFFCTKVKQVDVSDPAAIKKTLDDFWLAPQLVEEFKRQPDERFTPAVAEAIKLYRQEYGLDEE